MRDDDDVLLLARADIIPHPPRAVDVVVLVVALERARVLVPFRIPFALGPIEPLLRELGFGFFERSARVAGPAAAFLKLGEDHDGDGVGTGCGGQDGREAEEHGLEGSAEGRDEDDGIGRVERGEDIRVASRDREALSHSALRVCVGPFRRQPCDISGWPCACTRLVSTHAGQFWIGQVVIGGWRWSDIVACFLVDGQDPRRASQ